MEEVPPCCFVTAYFDIGREQWTKYRRSRDEYLEYFEHLVALPVPLVVFIDTLLLDRVQTILSKRTMSPTKIVPIDEAWMKANIYSWTYVPEVEKVMSDPIFKQQVAHRFYYPEHSVAKYNCINYAKVDFVQHVIEQCWMPTAVSFSWIDFGMVREALTHPPRTLMRVLSTMNHDRINYYVVEDQMIDDYADPFYVLHHAPDMLVGGFFFATAPLIKLYRDRFHQTVRKFLSLNIADDDQAIVVNMSFDWPDMFAFHLSPRRSFLGAFENLTKEEEDCC
jgi:hypothetical protein